MCTTLQCSGAHPNTLLQAFMMEKGEGKGGKAKRQKEKEEGENVKGEGGR